MKRLSFLTFSFLFLTVKSHALDLDLTSEVKERRSTLAASYENASFSLPDGDIKGSGIKIDFSHAFKKDYAMEVYLSSAINGQQSSFTGLGGYLYYTLLGNCCEVNKTVTVGGQPVLTERELNTNSLRIGFGVDQFLLNGSKAVYSASGIGFGASYQFALFNYQFKASIRSSTMSVNTSRVQGLFYGLGMVFPL
jgi:hypothetical protein